MSDFKVGDRVEYTGNIAAHLTGKRGVVIEHEFNSHNMTYVQFDSGKPWECMNGSIQLANPDPIIINRADLPDVRPLPSGLLRVNGSNYHDRCTAAEWRESANRRLALAEFLEAREKAAVEAAAADKEVAFKLTKRRDELADELAPRMGPGANWYTNVSSGLQRAIDRIIELEDAAK